jgi:hypothetical protein
MWVVSWCGNFAGCAIFTGLIVATKIFEGRDWYALLMATKKVGGLGALGFWGWPTQLRGARLDGTTGWMVSRWSSRCAGLKSGLGGAPNAWGGAEARNIVPL